jgi:hypothetical protein
VYHGLDGGADVVVRAAKAGAAKENVSTTARMRSRIPFFIMYLRFLFYIALDLCGCIFVPALIKNLMKMA